MLHILLSCAPSDLTPCQEACHDFADACGLPSSSEEECLSSCGEVDEDDRAWWVECVEDGASGWDGPGSTGCVVTQYECGTTPIE